MMRILAVAMSIMAVALVAGCHSPEAAIPTLAPTATPSSPPLHTPMAGSEATAVTTPDAPGWTPFCPVDSAPLSTLTPKAPAPALLSQLHWLGHAAFRFDGPPVIYIDVTDVAQGAPPAEAILISHEHSDHYAPAALKQIATADTVIITNQRVADLLAKSQVPGRVMVLAAGASTTVGEVQIEAAPAYNVVKSYHPLAAGGLGFIITWQGERLYFAGDTERIPEMAQIDCAVALLPIDGTYTMNVDEAAQAARDIQPRVAIPMHNRNGDPEAFIAAYEGAAMVLPLE